MASHHNRFDMFKETAQLPLAISQVKASAICKSFAQS